MIREELCGGNERSRVDAGIDSALGDWRLLQPDVRCAACLHRPVGLSLSLSLSLVVHLRSSASYFL